MTESNHIILNGAIRSENVQENLRQRTIATVSLVCADDAAIYGIDNGAWDCSGDNWAASLNLNDYWSK